MKIKIFKNFSNPQRLFNSIKKCNLLIFRTEKINLKVAENYANLQNKNLLIYTLMPLLMYTLENRKKLEKYSIIFP
jgi:hypothetical protein